MKSSATALLICVLVVVINGFAQRRPVEDTRSSVRLDKAKPSIYLEFVKAEVCRPSLKTTIESWPPCLSDGRTPADEPYDAVWLRLRNNSRWAVNFDALSVYVGPLVDVYKLPDGKLVTSFIDGAELRARYRVDGEIVWEWVDGPNGRESKRVEVNVPIVNRVANGTSRVWLRPGRSVIFVVEREHLAKHLSVYLAYKYFWDGDQNDMVSDEPTHRVYFSWYALREVLGNTYNTYHYFPSETPSAIRAVDFANFTYPAEPIYSTGVKNFTLKDGEYSGRRIDGASEPEPVSLVHKAYGDVTNDGQDEALLVLTKSVRGTAIPYYVYVYSMQRDKPKLLESFETGDRAEGGLRQVSAENGRLVVELYGKYKFVGGDRSRSDDSSNGACCPNLFTRSRYEWKNNRFRRTGQLEILKNPSGGVSLLTLLEKR
jgi:hypothetical protein